MNVDSGITLARTCSSETGSSSTTSNVIVAYLSTRCLRSESEVRLIVSQIRDVMYGDRRFRETVLTL